MSRIDPPARPALWIRVLFFLCRKRYGKTFQPLQVAAHVPSFLLPFLMTNRFAHGRGELPDSTRLLAMQLVGELNRCDWCIDFGRSLATRSLREKILHVREFATHPDFSAAERAALRYAFEATRVPVEVTDETFAALRGHFSDRQIVELTFAMAIENFFNHVNAPLGIEAEGFCAVPPGGYKPDDREVA
jgi:alkylhydroperoxidase family enzyme